MKKLLLLSTLFSSLVSSHLFINDAYSQSNQYECKPRSKKIKRLEYRASKLTKKDFLKVTLFIYRPTKEEYLNFVFPPKKYIKRSKRSKYRVIMRRALREIDTNLCIND